MISGINSATYTYGAAAAKTAGTVSGRSRETLNIDINNLIDQFSPIPSIQLNFMRDFMKEMQAASGTKESIENMSRRYAELRKEIIEQYSEDQDTMYERLGDLNSVFALALRRAVVPTLRHLPGPVIIEKRLGENKPAMQPIPPEQEAKENIVTKLHDNLLRHMDTFFMNFIYEIQNNDFQSAFENSLADLLSAESQSLEDISFRDAVRIRDILFEWHIHYTQIEEDAAWRYNSLNAAFRALDQDESISLVIREAIAGFLRESAGG